MGIFDKVKNMFTDEIEDEIKKEMIQVEIPAPAKIETRENIADTKIIKNEEKQAPIFFDDAYFKELEQPKKEVKSSYKKIVQPQEKKLFKATPIISPVYGVLDKNYHKEEIMTRKNNIIHSKALVSVDDVRKKAFGTLEDDLETTLFGTNSILFKEEQEDLFDEMTKEDVIDINLEEVTNDTLEEEDLFDLIDSMYDDKKGENE